MSAKEMIENGFDKDLVAFIKYKIYQINSKENCQLLQNRT